MANLCFLKTEKVASTPLTRWLLRLTLPPGKVVPPIFFHENDRKGCKIEIIFFSVLEWPEKNRKGNNPPWLDEG